MATGSMDTTAKLWDVQTGQELVSLSVSIYHFRLFNFFHRMSICKCGILLLTVDQLITFPVSGIVEVGGERSWFSIFDVKIKLIEERGI